MLLSLACSAISSGGNTITSWHSLEPPKEQGSNIYSQSSLSLRTPRRMPALKCKSGETCHLLVHFIKNQLCPRFLGNLRQVARRETLLIVFSDVAGKQYEHGMCDPPGGMPSRCGGGEGWGSHSASVAHAPSSPMTKRAKKYAKVEGKRWGHPRGYIEVYNAS